MNTIGNNAFAMLQSQAQEMLADLAQIDKINGANCTRVKDAITDAKKLAKDVDESRKLVKQPHLDAAAGVDTAYVPIRDTLNEAAQRVNKLLETWVLAEKRKAEAEAAEARRIAIEAQKALEEEDPFLCDETKIAAANTAAAVADSKALASRQVMSASGASRTSSLRTVRFADVTDAKALVLHYAEHPDVLGAATKLANGAIRAAKGGPVSIPGVIVKSEERLV